MEHPSQVRKTSAAAVRSAPDGAEGEGRRDGHGANMAACDDPINGIRAGAAGAARLAPSIRQLVNEVRGADREQAARVLQRMRGPGGLIGVSRRPVMNVDVTT